MDTSLLRRKHNLSSAQAQVDYLTTHPVGERFETKLQQSNQLPYKALQPDTLQVNMGKMCNQVCKHCHVDAGPDRKEIATKETLQQCLDFLATSAIQTVDLTGGAPEMNPHFRWFVEEITKLGRRTIVRCNLTIIVANPTYYDLPDFFACHQVEVVSSLPSFSGRKTDAQRGEGVFERSIRALKMLNKVGYGKEDSSLTLNLVYNPTGAFLPTGQNELEQQFKIKLATEHGLVFNQLFAITNMPISRYLEYLLNTGNYEAYMDKLITAFNPAAAENTMCKTTLSVSWDGYLFDCDFNQMLDLKIANKRTHISQMKASDLAHRTIRTGQHCYGCTAGAGSSCGGEVAG